MRIAVLGRTGTLLATARALLKAGHTIPLVGTCRAEEYYDVREADFEEFAASAGADFFCRSAINAPEIKSRLQGAECDLAVSVNWLTLLGADAIGAFRLGVLNAHAGDLPRYRGNACPNWAIINGEPRIGLCIHFMDADRLDAGAVVSRGYFDLNDDLDVSDVYAWLADAVPRQFLAAVEGLSYGTAKPVPQSEAGIRPLRCYPRRPEDSRISWSQSTTRIHRLIRASTRPFSGAFCQLNGDGRVTVWKAGRIDAEEDWLAVPGQVVFAAEGDPVVACADGMLRLTDVSLEGAGSVQESKALIAKSLRNRLV